MTEKKLPLALRTKANVTKFLNELATSGNVSKAAYSIGATRSAVYYWRSKDAAFREAWDDAIECSMDDLEEVARIRAKEGPTLQTVTKDGEVVEYQGAPSDAMLKYLLTNKRFKEHGVEKGSGTVNMNFVGMTDAQLLSIIEKGLAQSGEKVIDAEPPKQLESTYRPDNGGEPCRAPKDVKPKLATESAFIGVKKR